MRRLGAVVVAAVALIGLTAGATAAELSAAPGGLTAIALDAGVELAWQPVQGASGYAVYRGDSASSITQQLTPAGGSAATTFTDASAQNGVVRYYNVRAVVAGTESSVSSTASAMPVARSCTTGNPVVLENCFPGNAPWRVVNPATVAAGGIEGYATSNSVNKGESVDVKINTTQDAPYRIEVYRSGYYGGAGARLFSTILGLRGTRQPACTSAPKTTGLLDCSNWSVSATVTTTASWPSGIYLLRLVRESNGADNHILFVVRDDSRASELLYGVPFTTYEAYNNYGGKSLYDYNSTGPSTVSGGVRAVKVSFDRPFEQARVPSSFNDWYTRTDFGAVSWLERSGYDVAYQSGSDMELNGARVRDHRAYMLGAHDEYYSAGMRTALEQARDANVDLFNLGANAVYWKIRFENGPSGGQNRIEVCYKTIQGGAADPVTPTTTWRDPSGPKKPENALLGVMYVGDNSGTFYPLKVSTAEGGDRVFRFTGLDTAATGSTSIGTSLVGWEWDARVPNGFEPSNVKTLASSPVSGNLIQNNGQNYLTGPTTANAAKYRAASGALVFSTGTNQWSRGLAVNAEGVGEPDLRVQQTTTNALEDMGVAPRTPAANIRLDDAAGPDVVSTIPSDGQSSVSLTTLVKAVFTTTMDPATITNTSFTLRNAAGTLVPATVSYESATTSATLVPTQALAGGTTYTARLDATVKAADGTPLAAAESWTFATTGCPCSLFTTQLPATQFAGTFELGVKIKVDEPLALTSVRFYKSAQETGSHTATVWTAGGARLASVAFTNESASGWQQQALAVPVQLQANVAYVVSVNANTRYVVTTSGLQAAVGNGPLHSVADGANGVYNETRGTFPNKTYSSSNYFVDVVVSNASVPLTVTDTTPAAGATGVQLRSTIRAMFSKALDPATVTASSFTLEAGGSAVPATVAYDAAANAATLTPNTPLAAGLTYTAHLGSAIRAADGTALTGSASWSFTTASCPCSLFSSVDQPSFFPNGKFELGVKVKVDEPLALTTLRFYKAPGETGAHDGTVWSAGGVVLARVSFTGETASGWQSQPLGSALQLQANAVYVISVNANTKYPARAAGLQTEVSSGPFHSVADGANGVYNDIPGSFPSQTYNSTNYYVDAVVDRVAVPLSVIALQPAGSATGVQQNSVVRATFSKQLDPATITGSTFVLRDSAGTQVAASVTYDSASSSATLTPSAPLAFGTTYTATIDASVRATDGTTLGSAYSWTFSTLSCPCSLFSSVQQPALFANGRFELGVKLTTDQTLSLTAVRFFKSGQETGAHTATVWSAAGIPLASVAFSDETASGWQQQALSSPLQIQAGATYVVSVNINASYAVTQAGLQTQVVAGPLRTIADGANGVYSETLGSFPTQSYNSSNYFVDVVAG